MIEIPLEYLPVAHAVTYVEMTDPWAVMRDAISRGVAIDAFIKAFQRAADRMIADDTVPTHEQAEFVQVKEQVATPLFRQYLAAKLGMM